ncbi:uncharacterized protein AMSG_11092 [Thecamonas trahens ATCC 50062]|uniref:Uncharacterized protein n=1 Tax=Thecamonas trahens ATCC 50062 TaxID=461836 RepID=A0A0L0DT32_THETB|nr:hypothetical protein AMSG_11092 [Thecamonas trahens ATCC 50062]KNC55430.1 hypothetical protein AMSG_11092 [Thecamonas trahens ATCC 50062]|eukprot:XP_013752967.1 hypothetical protein AMSG_11092 [Thecamonas trahens ATCC 50062]
MLRKGDGDGDAADGAKAKAREKVKVRKKIRKRVLAANQEQAVGKAKAAGPEEIEVDPKDFYSPYELPLKVTNLYGTPRHIEPNTHFSIPYANELFEGHVSLVFRGEPRDPHFDSIYDSWKTVFEIQLQGKLKVKTRSTLYMGIEAMGPVSIGIIGRALGKILLKLIRSQTRGMDGTFNEGDDLRPHICFPMAMFADRFVWTPEGETPPAIGQYLDCEDDESAKARKKAATMDDRYGPDSGILTMSFRSPRLDMVNWKIIDIPGMKDINFAPYLAGLGLQIVAYDMPPDWTGIHLDSAKQYYFCFTIENTGTGVRARKSYPASVPPEYLYHPGDPRLDAALASPRDSEYEYEYVETYEYDEFARDEDEPGSGSGSSSFWSSGGGGSPHRSARRQAADDDDDDDDDDDLDADMDDPFEASLFSPELTTTLKTPGARYSSISVPALIEYYPHNKRRVLYVVHAVPAASSSASATALASPPPPLTLPMYSPPPSIAISPESETGRMTYASASDSSDAGASSGSGHADPPTPSRPTLPYVRGRSGSAGSRSERATGAGGADAASSADSFSNSSAWTEVEEIGEAAVPIRSQADPEGLRVSRSARSLTSLKRGSKRSSSGSRSQSRSRSRSRSRSGSNSSRLPPTTLSARRTETSGSEYSSGSCSSKYEARRAVARAPRRRSGEKGRRASGGPSRFVGVSLSPLAGEYNRFSAVAPAVSGVRRVLRTYSDIRDLEAHFRSHSISRKGLKNPKVRRYSRLAKERSALDAFLSNVASARSPAAQQLLALFLTDTVSGDARFFLSGAHERDAADLSTQVKFHTSAVRALDETYWREETALLYSDNLSFCQFKRKARLHKRQRVQEEVTAIIALDDVLSVGPLEDSNTPFDGFVFVKIVTLERVHYVCVASEEVAAAFVAAISAACHKLRASRRALSSAVTQVRASSAGSQQAVYVYSVPRFKSRLLLNGRRLLFNPFAPSMASAVAPWEVIGELLREGTMLRGSDVHSVKVNAFLDATVELKRLRMDEQVWNHNQKVAFFLNAFHLLVVHALIVLGTPSSKKEARQLYTDYSYQLGEYVLSAAEIEHAILRAPATKHPARLQKTRARVSKLKKLRSKDPVPRFEESDPRAKFVLDRVDWRLNFAIISGSLGSVMTFPVYHPDHVDSQLNSATSAYLNAFTSVSETTAVVTLPNQCAKLIPHLGATHLAVLRRLEPFYRGSLAAALQRVLDSRDKNVSIHFAEPEKGEKLRFHAAFSIA